MISMTSHGSTDPVIHDTAYVRLTCSLPHISVTCGSFNVRQADAVLQQDRSDVIHETLLRIIS